MERQGAKDGIVRATVLVLFYVGVEVADIDQERRALAVVEVRQVSILDQPPQLPLTHAKVFSSLACA